MNLLYGIIFTSGFLQIICSPDSSSEHDVFGYDEGDPLGPNHWPEKFKTCAGKYQSPIDIEENLVTRVSLAPLEFSGFDALPQSISIMNSGYTVKVLENISTPITLSGGPLQSPTYKFAQFHFHWGANDSLGSEDLINNHSYPMELHMVFFNADYQDVTTAQFNFDGLVVLAYFFEISETDNVAYAKIIDSLKYINKPHTSVKINDTFSLSSLLPKNRDNYFTYIGSLTTPPCSEGVRWIDFKHPIRLSHAQLEQFRNIRSNDGILTHNFRPIQPLSNRPVWYNSGSPRNSQLEPENQKGGSMKKQISLVLFICSVAVPKIYF